VNSPGPRPPGRGAAWLCALTERAGMDPARLARGRAYARGSRVRDVAVLPGAVEALVQGSRARPFAVAVRVPVFSDAGWARLLDEVAGEVGHLAALLDGDPVPGLGADLDLRPGPGELETWCSCPGETGPPCEHVAAVCHAAAGVLDADPFALLLLRGLAKEEVLAELRDRRPPSWPAPAGMLARDAYQRVLAPLPPAAPPLPRPGIPAALPEPPPASGVSRAELAQLAATAAQRAWELLSGAPQRPPLIAGASEDDGAAPDGPVG
jgi:hypothetical protein